MNWREFETRIGGERVSNYAWCIGIIIATLLLKKPAAHILTRITGALVNRFTTKEDTKLFRSLTQRPMELLLQTIFFYVAVNQLSILLNTFLINRYKEKIDALAKTRQDVFSVSFGDIADHLFMFFVIFFSILFLSRIIDFIYSISRAKAFEEDNKERIQLLPLLKEVAKLVLWSIGLFWVMGSVFHVNIPALIAGLGIGGVAIALAAKTSVENLFAAFTILTDKPFQTGDTVKIGAHEGAVERIGFRSTRLRSAEGALYIIPNQKMVTENIENLSKRDIRRVRIIINIKYGLGYEVLQKMTNELKTMVKQIAHVNDPVDVSLEAFEENVFQLVLSYHLPSPLQEGASLSSIKNEVSMRTYEIVSKYSQIAS